MPKLQVIVFSKNRPLQLHGYLSSLFLHCREDVAVKVLARTEPVWFQDAYAQVEHDFPNVEWRHETDFRADLDDLIGETPYTMFGCDDVAFTREWAIEWAFDRGDCLGLSLRLGQHITRDMFGNPMPPPSLWPYWSVEGAGGDWGYPWEVLGTVYRTDFVRRMVQRVQANSPSQLEERGSRCWAQETPLRTFAAWPESRIVVPTVNLVQSEFPNGICGTVPLDVGFLLECWNHNLRLDVARYAGMTPSSWRVPDFFMVRL
jgi:hypothetical protein